MNELGSGRALWVRPRRRGVFRLSVGRGRPAVRRHVGRGRTPRGKFFRSCAVSGGLRRGACFCAGQILSLVRRVGRPSPRGVFLRGANPFARALCREAFAEESVLAWGKSFRSCAVSGGFRRGACSCAGQILSLVRRVGRLSPRGRVPARDKSFRSCAVSGCFRRGEPSRAGQILLLVRRFGRPSPRGVFLRG